MFDFLWNIASFIVALGLLVSVHEYGHFWVARKCGVRVEKFSIGFGKTLWRTYDKHGTEFVIALIPLGGFVKMLDERVDDVAEEDKQYAFSSKSVYQRMAIVAAGPIANFLFAIVAFYLMFIIGISSVKPIIGNVEIPSIASSANLDAQRQIVSVNNENTQDWQAINMALIAQLGEDTLTIGTKAIDSTYVTHHQLDTSNWHFEPSKTSAMQSLGIVPYIPKISPIVAAIDPQGTGAKSGLLIGDEIISVEGVNLYGNWQSFVDIIQRSSNLTLPITVSRNDINQNISLFVGTRKGTDGHNTGYIGVSPTIQPWPDSYKIDISYGPIEAISKALDSTWNLISLSFNMIGKLFTGVLGVDNLSGPISIAKGAGDSAGVSLAYFLQFLALISINLGIINLFPLPILDGGHLFYYFIELVSGRPVPEKVQELGFKLGALILLSLMSIALFNDFARLS